MLRTCDASTSSFRSKVEVTEVCDNHLALEYDCGFQDYRLVCLVQSITFKKQLETLL